VILLAEMTVLISTVRNFDLQHALICINAAAGRIGDSTGRYRENAISFYYVGFCNFSRGMVWINGHNMRYYLRNERG
jgi:hypothetical protein